MMTVNVQKMGVNKGAGVLLCALMLMNMQKRCLHKGERKRQVHKDAKERSHLLHRSLLRVWRARPLRARIGGNVRSLNLSLTLSLAAELRIKSQCEWQCCKSGSGGGRSISAYRAVRSRLRQQAISQLGRVCQQTGSYTRRGSPADGFIPRSNVILVLAGFRSSPRSKSVLFRTQRHLDSYWLPPSVLSSDEYWGRLGRTRKSPSTPVQSEHRLIADFHVHI